MKRREFLTMTAGVAGAALASTADSRALSNAGEPRASDVTVSGETAAAGSLLAVTVTPNESARRVDVAIGGQPFTSYIWPERVKKPVLDPIRSATGTIVTRGWPLNPRPGERVDHPHHVGLWLNYESVNGVDFWNNSDAIKPQDAPKMGTIRHQSIVSAKGGADQGELEVEADWRTYDKRVLLKEHTRYVF